MSELMLVAFVALLVIGPERLPEVLRTLGLWFGRMRRSFLSVKTEIEKEIGMDEIRRQLHNEAVMDEMKRIEAEVQNSIDPNVSAADSAAKKDHSDAGADVTDDIDHSDHANSDSAQNETDSADLNAAEAIEDEPSPRPVSEAELEAMHAARQKKAAREIAEADATSTEKSN